MANEHSRSREDSTRIMPTVSAVIPVYNREHTILRAIESILSQDHPVTEVIVVDDASTDRTCSVVKSIQDSRIRLIRHTVNRNGAAARNTGLQQATGALVTFLDSDDVWLPGKLRSQLNAFLQHESKHTDIVLHGKSLVVGPNRTVVVPRRAPRSGEDLATYFLARGGNFALGSVLLRTAVAQSVQFDERMHSFQELDFGIRLERSGVRPVFVDIMCQEMNRNPADSTHVSSTPRYDHLLSWAQRNRSQLTLRSYASFMAHFVGFRVIAANRRLYGAFLVARGIVLGVVSPTAAAAAVGRLVLPLRLYERIRRLAR